MSSWYKRLKEQHIQQSAAERVETCSVSLCGRVINIDIECDVVTIMQNWSEYARDNFIGGWLTFSWRGTRRTVNHQIRRQRWQDIISHGIVRENFNVAEILFTPCVDRKHLWTGGCEGLISWENCRWLLMIGDLRLLLSNRLNCRLWWSWWLNIFPNSARQDGRDFPLPCSGETTRVVGDRIAALMSWNPHDVVFSHVTIFHHLHAAHAQGVVGVATTQTVLQREIWQHIAQRFLAQWSVTIPDSVANSDARSRSLPQSV